MKELLVKFNNTNYVAIYNENTGYYEVEIKAPKDGGIYEANLEYTDSLGNTVKEDVDIQILVKEKIKLASNKNFIWIFDYRDFSVKDIIEISDYEFDIDEETNDTSYINVAKKIDVKKNDIIAYKKNNEPLYFGVIKEVLNNDGELLYKYTSKYITNMFDVTIKLNKEEMIKEIGIEDFIANAITENFIANADIFLNKAYLKVNVKTHTKKQVSVSNAENGIYNLHTWMTNCTQKYDIVYNFSIEDKSLIIDIENKTYKKELIDTQAQAISNYSEVFETNVVAKVRVLTSGEDYSLYLLNDRTTTTDMLNPNRAEGTVKTIYTEKYEDAPQKALDEFKVNSYNHKISFNILERKFKIGTPVSIKTKNSIIYDTYISAIKIKSSKFIEYTCGNIRTNFIDKLLKERR
ncbi:MAG: hypothetical protein J6K45_04835 [Clostridia bacterium]|nr:hypothetical protein [Clostridia bacterium]